MLDCSQTSEKERGDNKGGNEEKKEKAIAMIKIIMTIMINYLTKVDRKEAAKEGMEEKYFFSFKTGTKRRKLTRI